MSQIVMLNGAFGVGKTTLAAALLKRRSDWMAFDPEEVGFMLWKILDIRSDFQNLPAWGPLVVETARALIAAERRTLVVPMTLVDPGNYETIRRGFEGIAPTHHFALVAPKVTIERRLAERDSDRWAFDQIDRCLAALARPEFAVHLDAERPVDELADRVLDATRP